MTSYEPLVGIVPNLQIFSAVWHRDKLVRLRGDWLIRSGYSESKIWSNEQLGGVFSPVSGMHGCILIKLISVIYNSVHMTLVTFSRSRNQRSRSHATFSENSLLCVKDHLVLVGNSYSLSRCEARLENVCLTDCVHRRPRWRTICREYLMNIQREVARWMPRSLRRPSVQSFTQVCRLNLSSRWLLLLTIRIPNKCSM